MRTNLESDLRAVYGAYEYLRAHDLTASSATSRLLHQANFAILAGRVRDELAELSGTIAGTHGHGGGRDDVVLEAYQSIYWLMLLAVAANESYDDVRPHAYLTGTDATDAVAAWPDLREPADGRRPSAEGGPEMERSAAFPISISLANYVAAAADTSPQQLRQAIQSGFALVGRLCREGGIAVHDAVRRDANELRAKEYLAGYWAAYDARLS